MGPREGCAPRMGRRHASAAGQRARESPTAAGTGTEATPGHPERQRAGDRTLSDWARGGCRRPSRSPRIPPAAGQGPAEGGSPTTATPPAPETEPPPQGGEDGIGAQPAGSSSKGGVGQGASNQPSEHHRPTAAGKRPVQAGSPGLSTPSKPKRGHAVAGTNTASREPAPGRHRPAAARGLFALGFTVAATMTSPRDEGQGRASVPPRELETPGKGQGGAHGEDI